MNYKSLALFIQCNTKTAKFNYTRTNNKLNTPLIAGGVTYLCVGGLAVPCVANKLMPYRFFCVICLYSDSKRQQKIYEDVELLIISYHQKQKKMIIEKMLINKILSDLQEFNDRES